MNRLLELAALGARETMMAQSVNANNLANTSTPGFRKDLINYTGTKQTEGLVTAVDLAPGNVQGTGHHLDVAISGEGYFAVQSPNGSEAYSRRGDFRVDSLGQMTDGAGNPVIGEGGPVALPPFSSLEIGTDGTISIFPLGDSSAEPLVIDRLKLVTLDESLLEKGLDGFLRLPQGQVVPPDAQVKVVSGALEASNVSPVDALVRMIDLQRKFESHVEMMETAKENRQRLDSVMTFN